MIQRPKAMPQHQNKNQILETISLSLGILETFRNIAGFLFVKIQKSSVDLYVFITIH